MFLSDNFHTLMLQTFGIAFFAFFLSISMRIDYDIRKKGVGSTLLDFRKSVARKLLDQKTSEQFRYVAIYNSTTSEVMIFIASIVVIFG